MAITDMQRKISDIIEAFENGAPNRYGGLVHTQGDSGGLSGGELMASLTSGSLGKLCRLYATKGGTRIPERLIQMAEKKDAALNTSAEFRAAWKAAATDRIMQEAQDEFFYDAYQLPGERWCRAKGFVLPLSIAVVMDSMIHGSFPAIAARVRAPLEEKVWIAEYLRQRRAWLAGHKNKVLNNTVYRMDTFLNLVKNGNWELQGPIEVLVGKSKVVVN